MSLPCRSEWCRLLTEAAVIAAVAALFGLFLHHRLILETLTDGGGETAAAAAAAYPAPATLEEVRSLLTAGALAVDARLRDLYREGHLAGAVSLPMQEVEAGLASFRSRVPATRTLVVYCSGSGCPDSFDLAVRLKGAGYRDVRVFEEGFPAWQEAGLQVETGEP
jgi:rhodanese-related sulfurtransferase